MENNLSEKIRLILNELAILNQPEQKENKIFYRIEDLLKIKSLASELYLCSDLATKSGEVFYPQIPVATMPEDDKVLEPEVPALEMPLVEEPAIEEPVAEEPIQELAALVEEQLPLIEPDEDVAEPEAPAAEEISSALSIEELIDTHEPSEALQDAHQGQAPRLTAEHLSAQMSFTRRFEFINQLFAGNTERFMEFLDEVGYSRDVAHAMQIFDRHFHENNWSRRQESADEFRRVIQRSC